MVLCIAIVLIGIVGVASKPFELPSFFSVCSRDLPNQQLEECLLASALKAKPYIGKGIKILGIPSFSPLVLPQITLAQGNGAVSGRVTLTNLTIIGLDDYYFKNLSFDANHYELKGVVNFPTLSVNSQYDLAGKILFARVKGVGSVAITTGSTNAAFSFKGTLRKHDGHDYILSDGNPQLKLQSNDVKVHFDGVVNNNQELSLATNRILNENGIEILEEMLPAIERVTGGIIEHIWSSMNKHLPYNIILPTSKRENQL